MGISTEDIIPLKSCHGLGLPFPIRYGLDLSNEVLFIDFSQGAAKKIIDQSQPFLSFLIFQYFFEKNIHWKYFCFQKFYFSKNVWLSFLGCKYILNFAYEIHNRHYPTASSSVWWSPLRLSGLLTEFWHAPTNIFDEYCMHSGQGAQAPLLAGIEPKLQLHYVLGHHTYWILI